MPRFYLHVQNGLDVAEDSDGIDLPDFETAQAEARQAALDLWSEMLSRNEDPSLYAVEIADESGRVLVVIPFAPTDEGYPSLH